MIVNIIYNIMTSLQLVADALISLLFQPVFILIQLIESIKLQWKGEDEGEEKEYKEPTHVNGFHTSEVEVNEIKKIKKELGQ